MQKKKSFFGFKCFRRLTTTTTYHVGNVDAGTVATADDAETETAAGFLQQFHFDDIEHVVVFEGSLVAIDHHPDFGRRLPQNGQRPTVGDVTEALAVDLQDLVSGLEPLVSSGRAVRVHFVNQNGSLEDDSQTENKNKKSLTIRVRLLLLLLLL